MVAASSFVLVFAKKMEMSGKFCPSIYLKYVSTEKRSLDTVRGVRVPSSAPGVG